jgi:small subunit ribosomal protein S18
MQHRRGGPRRTTCELCGGDVKSLDYKDIDRLESFLDEGGRIRSRRRTKTCARHQRMITSAVKRARHIALLPYSPKHTR